MRIPLCLLLSAIYTLQIAAQEYGWYPRTGADLPYDNVYEVSSDGTYLAASTDDGSVKIYQWKDDAWTQIGDEITGEIDDNFGSSISISENGDLVAIGSAAYTAGYGYVQVFSLESSSWQKVGDDIEALGIYDHTGLSIDMDKSGEFLAVGSKRYHGLAGAVRVFQKTETGYHQIGELLEGHHSYDYFGIDVELSDDGSILAVGASQQLNDSADHTGYVAVYKWDGAIWGLRGNEISGNDPEANFGRVLELNGDGTAFASNSIYNSEVRTYSFDGSDWNQFGGPITNNDISVFGYGWMSINFNGKVVAVCGLADPAYGNQTSAVQVYELVPEPETWRKKGEVIIGSPGDLAGMNLQLDSTGNVVFINKTIYDFSNGPYSVNDDLRVHPIDLFPNPTTGILHHSIPGHMILNQAVYDISGRPVFMGTDSSPIDISTLPAGLYTIRIVSEMDTYIGTIVKQ